MGVGCGRPPVFQCLCLCNVRNGFRHQDKQPVAPEGLRTMLIATVNQPQARVQEGERLSGRRKPVTLLDISTHDPLLETRKLGATVRT